MNINDLIKKVQTKGADQSVATTGGGDYTPPTAGVTGARLVGYYEVGQHAGEYQGKPKVNNTVKLVYELIGSKHPPRETDGGEKIPVRLTLTLNLSTNEKAGYYKIFSRLRDEDTKHMVQLLGKPVMLTVVHKERGEGQNKRVYANIDKDSIKKPIIQQLDPETQDVVEVPFNVGPALSELKAFVWDFADAEMWDSIFIEGMWEERKDDKGVVTSPARSKNVLQEEISRALNFKALPCYEYAAKKITKDDSAALDESIGDVETPEKIDANPTQGSPDPLPGID